MIPEITDTQFVDWSIELLRKFGKEQGPGFWFLCAPRRPSARAFEHHWWVFLKKRGRPIDEFGKECFTTKSPAPITKIRLGTREATLRAVMKIMEDES